MPMSVWLTFIGLAVAILLSYWYFIVKWAKDQVAIAPRIPMAECPKHGMFDKKLMLTINVPTMWDEHGVPLPVDICPFCYNDSQKNVDSTLAAAKAGKL